MIGALKRAYDGFRGFGDFAFSVPPLDGAFLPNTLLDAAPVVCACRGADNLVDWGGVINVSSGAALLRLAPDGTTEDVETGAGAITALAAGKDGALYVAIGAEGRRARDWQSDLMTRGRTGSVWIIDAVGAARRLAGGLAYLLGIAEAPDGALIVALAWTTR